MFELSKDVWGYLGQMGWVGEWGAVDKNVPGGGNSKCNNPVLGVRQHIQEDLKEGLSRERAGHCVKVNTEIYGDLSLYCEC